MTDSMHQIVDKFPENKDVIHLLQETDTCFATLCEVYVAINDSLDALAHTKKSAEASARTNALRELCMAIEEELVTAIEGYRPI
jgi:HPt (histidine-containing phosphotransfer) domain-containing protein